jgi:hypothetical protein
MQEKQESTRLCHREERLRPVFGESGKTVCFRHLHEMLYFSVTSVTSVSSVARCIFQDSQSPGPA